MTDPTQSPLGKSSAYISEYDPSLLFPIPRIAKRDEIDCPNPITFVGHDIWNGYELSWLNDKGKPQVAIAQFIFSANSSHIIESKSFKLYLNSFNNSRFNSWQLVLQRLQHDLGQAANAPVYVKLFTLKEANRELSSHFQGTCLDELDICFDQYTTNPNLLTTQSDTITSENLYSDLLKSNCLVTGQPDWGSVFIYYRGPQINHASLLKYLVSFRNHNEFHEQCVERIYLDIWRQCRPNQLCVEARYTRRGGLDINPTRASHDVLIPPYRRLIRQ